MHGSLLSHFVGGTASIGAGKVLAMGLGFVGTMIISRYLPEEDLGQYFLILLIAEFLMQISGFGLFMAMPHFIAAEKDKQSVHSLVNTALGFQFGVIIVVGLLATMLRTPMTALFGSSPIAGLVLFVPLVFFLQSSMRLLQSILQGFMRWSRIGASDVIMGIIRFTLVIVLVSVLKVGILGLMVAEIGAQTVALVFAYTSLPVQKRFEFDLAALRRMLKFGFPLQLNDILTIFFSRIGTLIIGTLLGPANVAYYGIANKIPGTLNQIYITFRQVYFPLFSELSLKGEKERAARLLNTSTRLVSFVTALGALIATLFGREVIVLLFTERYLASTTAFTILMLGVNLSLIGYTLGISLVALGDTSKPPLINIAHTITSLIVNLLFIPVLGISGAALAGLAGSTSTNPLNVFFLRRNGINVKVMSYLKPVALLSAHIAVAAILRPVTLVQRGLFVVTFLAASPLLSIITIDEIANLLVEVRSMLKKSFHVGGVEKASNKLRRLFYVYAPLQESLENNPIDYLSLRAMFESGNKSPYFDVASQVNREEE